MREAAPVGEVVEEGPELLELGLGDGEIAQAAEHLGAVGEVRPVVHLDEQHGILRRQLLGLPLAVPHGKGLHHQKERQMSGGHYTYDNSALQGSRILKLISFRAKFSQSVASTKHRSRVWTLASSKIPNFLSNPARGNLDILEILLEIAHFVLIGP